MEYTNVLAVVAYPTGYDDNGFARRFKGGLFMPPYVLDVMEDLTEKNLTKLNIPHEVYKLNLQLKSDADILHKLEQQNHGPNTKIILVMCGVMSYQIPFSFDTMSRWQKLGATCIIGGPHVNETLAEMLDGVPAGSPHPGKITDELEKFRNEDFILYHGDAYSDKYGECLKNILEENYYHLYEGGWEDLNKTEIPKFKPHKGYTVDTISFDQQSGCPFWEAGKGCQFCGIGSLSGSKTRVRNIEKIRIYLFNNLSVKKPNILFPVGDNGARSENCSAFLKMLAHYRNFYDISLSLQADTQCYKIPEFLDLCQKAGVAHLFIGVETTNQAGLKTIGKFNNNPKEYKELCDKLWEKEIVPLGSIMVGLPHHTPKIIQEEVNQLCQDGFWPLFTVLSPALGSPLQSKIRNDGKTILWGEINSGDSSYPVLDHPNMSRKEIEKSYWECWRVSNSLRYQIPRLKRLCLLNRWFPALFMAMGFWIAPRLKTHPLLLGQGKIFDMWDRKPESTNLSKWQLTKLKIRDKIKTGWVLTQALVYLMTLVITTIPIWRMKRETLS
jgi:hypothetical protein